jgi:tripartite-type tricarboxylate transporter receptor subunit TctC
MRRIMESLLVAGCLALALAPAHSDDYPSRRITLIAPWPPAGAIDTTCRELAPGVGDLLGQPVVVGNRPGAGSTIGTADGAKAAPDGYTLVLAGSGSLAISPTLYKELPYDPRKDFTPIALVVRVPFILVVNPSLPIESVADLISYPKAHPGALTYGSGGAGSPHQLFAETALTDVIGGQIALRFADPAPALPLIKPR